MASLADAYKPNRRAGMEHSPRPKIDLSRAKDSVGKMDRAVASLADLLPRMNEGGRLAYDETGNIVGGYNPEGQVEKAINWLMPMGSVAEAVDTGKGIAQGVLKTFGGVGAKTADKEALAAAEALEKSGADMRDIWRQTGYFRAPWDGKWRWEIDDSGAKWNPTKWDAPYKEVPNVEESSLGDALNHPGLFEAYPELRDARVILNPNIEPLGEWHRKNDAIGLGDYMQLRSNRREDLGRETEWLKRIQDPGGDSYWKNDVRELINDAGYSPRQAVKEGRQYLNDQRALVEGLRQGKLKDHPGVALHELQHGIQGRERFASGNSADSMAADIAQARYNVKEIEQKMQHLQNAALDQAGGILASQLPHDQEFARNAIQKWTERFGEYSETNPFGVDPQTAVKYELIENDDILKRFAMQRSKDAKLAALTPRDAYMRLAGEAEARLVQDRLPLTAAQRREQYPLDGLAAMLTREGIDPGDNFSNLITRYGDGPAMSVEPDLSRFGIGAPELRAASDNSLAATLERMRARNLEKGLDEDMATGAVRDEIARRNGVAMLGLPEEHTAMDRARAMGLDTPSFHYSRHGADISAFQPGLYDLSPFGIGTHVGTKEAAMDRAAKTTQGQGSTYPLIAARGREMLNDNGLPMQEEPLSMRLWQMKSDLSTLPYSEQNKVLGNRIFDEYDSIPYVNDVESPGSVSYILPPKNIRSRFAAFDPSRRDSANLLASLSGAAVLAPSLAAYLDRK